MLISISKKIDLTEKNMLSRIGNELKRLKEYGSAAEIFRKVGDYASLVEMNIEAENFEEAFELVKLYPSHKETVYVAYANHLAQNDRYIEAQKAFYAAGREDEAVRVLEHLTKVAVNEHRFREASYFYWILSMQTLRGSVIKDINNEADIKAVIKKFSELQLSADVYYAYSFIFNYLEEPFTMEQSEALFNMARYLSLELMKIELPGVSKFRIYYAAAKQGFAMKAYKFARTAYQQASMYRIPDRFRESVEISTMHIHAKPFSDSEDVLPLCYRCSTSNPLNNKDGNFCFNCFHAFVYSFISFEVLPVVEMFLDSDIDDDEAYRLLSSRKSRTEPDAGVVLENDGEYLKLEDNEFEEENDIFSYTAGENGPGPLMLNRKKLQMMNLSEVIICKWPYPLRTQYFVNVLPSVSISCCKSCNKLFHSDDYELEILKHNRCPFCRTPMQQSEEIEE